MTEAEKQAKITSLTKELNQKLVEVAYNLAECDINMLDRVAIACKYIDILKPFLIEVLSERKSLEEENKHLTKAGQTLSKMYDAELKMRMEALEILKEIILDMKKIPDARLPLGKNCWLQEWSEKQEELERVRLVLSAPETPPKGGK